MIMRLVMFGLLALTTLSALAQEKAPSERWEKDILAFEAADCGQRGELETIIDDRGPAALRMGRLRRVFEECGVFDKAQALVEKSRARAEALADEVQPEELRELLYYLIDSILENPTPVAEAGAGFHESAEGVGPERSLQHLQADAEEGRMARNGAGAGFGGAAGGRRRVCVVHEQAAVLSSRAEAGGGCSNAGKTNCDRETGSRGGHAKRSGSFEWGGRAGGGWCATRR